MEDEIKLGELALKLEKYRYNIIKAFLWPIYGMLISSASILGISLFLFGKKFNFNALPIFWAMLLVAGLFGAIITMKLMKYISYEKKRWRRGIVMFIPFFILYSLPGDQLYYMVIWYPALGLALLLTGLLVERNSELSVTNTLIFVGILILISSPILLLFWKIPLSEELMIASYLITVSLMLINYLIGTIYTLLRAERAIYGV